MLIEFTPNLHQEIFTSNLNFIKSCLDGGGHLRVRVVWTRFLDDKKVYKEHLILATDTNLTPVEVLRKYENAGLLKPCLTKSKTTGTENYFRALPG
jgi:hypothetical protein